MKRRSMKQTARRRRGDEFQIAVQQEDRSMPIKRVTPHDISRFRAVHEGHRQALEAYFSGAHVALLGSAGTGKTALGVFMGLHALAHKEAEKLIIVRSVVPTREMGFLPGDEEEKTAVYETPYRDLVGWITGKPSMYKALKDSGLIEFHSTSHLRGTTIPNAVLLIDEVQNLNDHELDTTVTRAGEGTRLVVVGDDAQCDFGVKSKDVSCIDYLRWMQPRIPGLELVHFTPSDNVRSGLSRDWTLARESRS